jgi:valyl-tRNA synthetase
MELLMGVITGIRNIRSEAEVHPSQKIDAYIDKIGDTQAELMRGFAPAISDMTRLNVLHVQPQTEKPDDASTYIYNDVEIYVPLKGLIDVENELAKLGREKKKVEVSLKQVNSKLNNEKFLANAPEAVVAKEKEKKQELDSRLERIGEAEQRLNNIAG